MEATALRKHPLVAALEPGRPAFLDSLAPDVALHSPITARVTIRGKENVISEIQALLNLLRNVEITCEFGFGSVRALGFRAHLRRWEVEGMQFIRLDEFGRVSELTLFVRPLPGLTGLAAELARRGSRRSVIVAVLGRPFAALVRVGDALGAPLVRPRRNGGPE